MKKVLIITYYWPPSGGSGVQRWLKMSKYLPEFGWQPVIYTASNAEYPVEDPSLERDVSPEAIVIRRDIKEPYNIYKKFVGIKKDKTIKAGFLSSEEKPSFKENLARWIRGNFFIPDARFLWVKPSVKYLLSYIDNYPVDTIISTGPPHSMHLIGKQIHNKTGIPWVADFRDPWTEIDFYGELKLTKWADKKHKRLEREVLANANEVVTVSNNWGKGLEQLGASKVKVIENGFDFDMNKCGYNTHLTGNFTLSHVGVIGPSRNAPNLWKALGLIAKENSRFRKDLEIRLIGQIDYSVIKSIKENDLENNTVIEPYVPHEEVVGKQCESQILLLLINNTRNAKGILTGKFYEYLYSGRPIFAVGPLDGDIARIINDTGAGFIKDYSDLTGIRTIISDLYDQFLSGGLPSRRIDGIEKYSRKSQAMEYSKVLNELIN